MLLTSGRYPSSLTFQKLHNHKLILIIHPLNNSNKRLQCDGPREKQELNYIFITFYKLCDEIDVAASRVFLKRYYCCWKLATSLLTLRAKETKFVVEIFVIINTEERKTEIFYPGNYEHTFRMVFETALL